jgi:hypothetical protein
MIWLKGLNQLKTFDHLIGNRPRELPACSLVPESIQLPQQDQSSRWNDFFEIAGNSDFAHRWQF